MNLKRALTFGLAIILGVGCGLMGVQVGESFSYPEAPMLVDGDALRAFMSDSWLRDTQNWLLENYILDQQVELEADETHSD